MTSVAPLLVHGLTLGFLTNTHAWNTSQPVWNQPLVYFSGFSAY